MFVNQALILAQVKPCWRGKHKAGGRYTVRQHLLALVFIDSCKGGVCFGFSGQPVPVIAFPAVCQAQQIPAVPVPVDGVGPVKGDGVKAQMVRGVQVWRHAQGVPEVQIHAPGAFPLFVGLRKPLEAFEILHHIRAGYPPAVQIQKGMRHLAGEQQDRKQAFVLPQDARLRRVHVRQLIKRGGGKHRPVEENSHGFQPRVRIYPAGHGL